MMTSIFAIAGAIGGSFLTVVLARYHTKESIVTGRSRCRSCRAVIRWYDNVPIVSYVFLRGRCRSCRASIGWRYPFLEVGSAFCAGIAWHIWGSTTCAAAVTAVAIAVIWMLLLAIAVYDAQTMLIPMVFVWWILGIMVAHISIALLLGAHYKDVLGDIGIGALIGWLPLFACARLSRERMMGYGDSYLGLIGGALVGWPEVIFFLTSAFGVGALYGATLLFMKKKKRHDAVPLGPFLVIGIYLTMILPEVAPTLTTIIPYFD